MKARYWYTMPSSNRLLTENDLGLNLQPMFDTVIFSSHADENLEPGLKGLSKHYLRYSQTTYSEVMG